VEPVSAWDPFHRRKENLSSSSLAAVGTVGTRRCCDSCHNLAERVSQRRIGIATVAVVACPEIET